MKKKFLLFLLPLLLVVLVLALNLPVLGVSSRSAKSPSPSSPTDNAPAVNLSLVQPAQSDTNTLALAVVVAAPGSQGRLGLLLTNQDAIAGGEVWLHYDSRNGLDITGVGITSRTTAFTTAWTKDQGTPSEVKVHFLFYNMSGQTIPPGSGSILDLSFILAGTASGATQVLLDKVLLSDISAKPLPGTLVNPGSVTVAANSSTPAPSQIISPSPTVQQTSVVPVSPTATLTPEIPNILTNQSTPSQPEPAQCH